MPAFAGKECRRSGGERDTRTGIGPQSEPFRTSGSEPFECCGARQCQCGAHTGAPIGIVSQRNYDGACTSRKEAWGGL